MNGKKEALAEIIKILEAGNIDEQFKGRNGNYYSKDKFIVTWAGIYSGMESEYSICITDSLYKSMTGYSAIYNNAGLFHEKQIKGFASIEMALLYVALNVLVPKNKRKVFFEKYVKPYNERVKSNKNNHEQPH